MAYDLIKISGLPLVTPDSGQDIVVGVGDYAKRINYNAVKADMVGTSPSYTTDTEPYLMRQTKNVGVVGKCALNKLVGGSLGWNQLCNGSSVTVPSGHKYYMKKSGTASIGASTGSALTGLTSGTDMVIDLTQMFGSTIADYVYGLGVTNGIAWLSKYIDLGTYHAYDGGSIQSVQATAHVTTGKNLLENTTATQTINGITFTRNADGSVTANGTATTNAQYIIYFDTSKIYGNLYFNGVSGGSSSTYQIYMWDSTDGSRAKKWNGTTNSGDSVNLTTLQEVKVTQGHIVTFVCRVIGGITVSNVRFYPMMTYPSNTDPTYEPYTAHTYSLGSDTLRGIPQLVSNKLAYNGDIKTPDGTITRKYGYVDMGTLSWAYNSGSGDFAANISAKALGITNIICAKYPTVNYTTVASMPDKSIKGNSGNTYISVKDSAYSTAAAFKTAMSGVYLVYELATETTESSTSYQKVQTIDADGTESFTTSTPVPVGHETQTPDNILAALGWLGE